MTLGKFLGFLNPVTNLAIFFADRGDVALQPCFQDPSWDVLKSHVIKSPNLNWFTLLAMSVENNRNGHTCRMPANFNRGYQTCQTSTILYADRGDRVKSQSLHRAHVVIFANRGDRRIKSPGVSLALSFKSLRFEGQFRPNLIGILADNEITL